MQINRGMPKIWQAISLGKQGVNVKKKKHIFMLL